MVPHRGALSIAELSRDGWGANTIGGQIPKELADKRATADLGDKGRPLNSARVDKDLKKRAERLDDDPS